MATSKQSCMHRGECRALGITSVCTVNRQMSTEELLTENRELKKQLRALKDQLECSADATLPTTPGCATESTTESNTYWKNAPDVIKTLQKNWVIVLLSMQTVYLCVVNASFSSY